MRYLKLSFAFAFLLGCSNAEAQNLLLPDQLNIDSLTVSPQIDSFSVVPHNKSPLLSNSLLPDLGTLTKMPTINFPDEAKILVWWPDSNIDYNMPNALSPGAYGDDIEILNGNKPKEKDQTGESDQ